jgi:ankyrin repeat protein
MKTLIRAGIIILVFLNVFQPGFSQPAYGYSSDLSIRFLEASSYGDYPVVVECLKKGVDVNTQNWDGATALMYATASGHRSMVELLLQKGANVNTQPHNGLTALITASQYGYSEIAEMLIADSANVKLAGNNRATALHYASLYNNDTIVFMLLAAGADPNALTDDKLTPLSMACINGSYESAYLLLEAGAELNTRDKFGFTPLMLASQSGSIPTAELLLSSGAHSNLQNNKGFSALSLAIVNKNGGMVKTLLENGANAEEANSISLNPRALAKFSGDTFIIREIKKAGGKPILFPSFKSMGGGIELNFNSADFITGVFITQHDFKYNLTYNFGFSIRPTSKKINFSIPDYGIYQFMERRNMFNFDLSKGFKFTSTSGINVGGRLMYHFGKYRGTNIHINGRLNAAPQAWVFVRKSNFEWRFGYHYSNYGEKDLAPSHITANLIYHFYNFKNQNFNRAIKWID